MLYRHNELLKIYNISVSKAEIILCYYFFWSSKLISKTNVLHEMRFSVLSTLHHLMTFSIGKKEKLEKMFNMLIEV